MFCDKDWSQIQSLLQNITEKYLLKIKLRILSKLDKYSMG